jgi:foldase protein PrsA
MVFQAFRNKRLMRVIMIVIVVAFAASLLWLGGGFGGGSKRARTVIAKVNGVSIKASEYEEAYISTANYLQQMYGEIPISYVEEIKYGALQQLIGQKLLVQQTRKARIKVSNKEINEQLSTIKQNYPSDSEFKSVLEQNGLTEAKLKQLIKEEMSVNKLRDMKSKVELTEEDLVKAYEQVEASHILISPVSGNWDAAKKQAENVLAEIRAGKSFASMAEKYSTDTATKSKGGELGFFARSGMDEDFANAAFALKVGDISEPVKSAYGYHLIHVTARKEAAGEEYEKAKEGLKEQIEAEKAANQYQEWFAQVHNEAKIVINDPALRAHHLAVNNQLSQSISEYQKAMEEDPYNPCLNLALGEVFRKLDDPERALSEYQAAVSKRETDPELHMILGMVYNEQGDSEKAAESFRKASSLDTINYRLHAQLKELFESLELSADARTEEKKMEAIQQMVEEQQKAYEQQMKAQEELQKKLNEAENQ